MFEQLRRYDQVVVGTSQREAMRHGERGDTHEDESHVSIMDEWLTIAVHYSVFVVNVMAVLIVMVGTIEAFFRGVPSLLLSPHANESRDVWLRYARWLVAGLTFLLAGDIIETSVAPTWDDVGRLGVIAVIRTGLSYFLERDIAEMRERRLEK